jgi:NADP-dependent 3-hydroxy acid dehydrogenase YdfG
LSALNDLARLRLAFGLGQEVDLVEEFTRRAARDGQVIRNLTSKLKERATQIGVACLKHDLTHSLACGHCLADAEQRLAEIDRLIRPAGAPMGSNAYFQVRKICEAKS